MSEATYNPPGITFVDRATGRTLKLITGGHADGWLAYWHPHYRNWVTLRIATEEDRRLIREACAASGMLPTRTWPYGTRKRCEVIEIIPRTGNMWDTVIVSSIEDPPEGFVLFENKPTLPSVGDTGEIVFTEGGPTGGYWKFEPGERSPADAGQ